MAKLYFKTGTMGSGKSRDLRRVTFNYIERGMNILTFKPILDTRDGVKDCFITSRDGDKIEADWIFQKDNIFQLVKETIEDKKISAVIIDEVQFLTELQIEQLQDIVLELNIPVLAYGLKTDFQGFLFPSIARLLALADDVEEIRSICWCGKRATQNARIINNKVTKDGNLIQIGGNESYIALCNKHFKNGKLK